LQADRRKDPPYWTLICGRGKARRSLSVGPATAAQAREYLAGLELLRVACEGLGAAGLPHPAALRHDGVAKLLWAHGVQGEAGAKGLAGAVVPPGLLMDAVRRSPDRDQTRKEVLRYLASFSRAVQGAARSTDGEVGGDAAKLERALEGLPTPDVHGVMTLARGHGRSVRSRSGRQRGSRDGVALRQGG
jgi:hypothetical protein